jgi:replicative DNA helicase
VAETLQSLDDVLSGADDALLSGQSAGAHVVPTGFSLLDTYLSGGLRSGELALLGGPQGLGKTTFVLQILRSVAKAGGAGIYFSYEHDAPTVLERMIAAEAGELLGIDAVSQRRVREAIEARDVGSGSLEQRLSGSPGGSEAVQRVREFASRVLVQRSSGSTTDLRAIRATIESTRERLGTAPLVIVDYLQKVPVPDGPDVEEERVTLVVEGLKDLALDLEVPVLAIVAAEKEGLSAGKRLRVHHLRGSSALAYEPDIVLLLNDKYDVVARHHLVFDVGNAERFRSWAVLTIEKNRSGMDKIDLEFRKRFDQARFETEGQAVEEQLVDERVFVE